MLKVTEKGNIKREDIEKAIEMAKSQAIMPRTVNSKKEAKELTKNDPFGDKWEVGDKYYYCISGCSEGEYRKEFGIKC